MVDLRAKLKFSGLPPDLVDFVCALVDQAEFENRLGAPTVSPQKQGGVELIWYSGPRRLRLLADRPGRYQFLAEAPGEAPVGDEVEGHGLVQQFRNLLGWLWDDPWEGDGR